MKTLAIILGKTVGSTNQLNAHCRFHIHCCLTQELLAGFLVACLVAQKRPPNYSLDDMPDTNFNCRDKILGGYYADPETDCQMFHVCVKVQGVGVRTDTSC
jgi:hypothetical protein